MTFLYNIKKLWDIKLFHVEVNITFYNSNALYIAAREIINNKKKANPNTDTESSAVTETSISMQIDRN